MTPFGSVRTDWKEQPVTFICDGWGELRCVVRRGGSTDEYRGEHRRPDAVPRRTVEDDGVRSPHEARIVPSPRCKRGTHNHRGTEVDGGRDRESGPRRCKHNRWIVGGHVDVLIIGGQDFDVAGRVDHRIVRRRAEISVVVRALPQSLDLIHHICTLVQHRPSQFLGPRHILSHHVQHKREREQGKHRRIPRQIVGANRVGQRAALQVAMLIGPLRRFRDFVPVGRCREQMGQQRIRIECNARYQPFQLRLGEQRAGRRWWRHLLRRWRRRWWWRRILRPSRW